MTKNKINEKAIRIIPLGGLGYIGKNITLFEYDNEIIIVDCGIMFPRDDMPGIDFVIPDFEYIRQNKKKVKALIITHGHEDHIGAVPFLLQEINVPIYATKLTIGLIQSRLIERPAKKEPEFIEVKAREIREIGNFTIEFIHVNHSIVGGVGLAIQTDIGTIIHSGDYKIDFSPVDGEVTDLYRFADHGEKGVLLLMSDSTNAERVGFTRSESVLMDKLVEIFSSSKGRVIAATFASNIHRIQQVLDTAQKYHRKVIISGLTMQKNVEIAHSLGFLNFKDDLIIDVSEANSLPHKKLVIICTGSQGEPMSALSRMAQGTHRHFTADKGDTVIITASVIPGNEKTVGDIVNSLMKMGARVFYDQDDDIHVSGHGSSKELKLLLSSVKPKFFMPIHGEYKHLKAHTLLAESLNIKPTNILIGDNGDMLELTQNSFKKISSLNLSQIYIDGKDIGDIESTVIKDRHTMSSDGILTVIITIAEGMMMREPDIISRGFVSHKEDKIIELIRKDISERVNTLLVNGSSETAIKASIKKNLKNFIFKLIRRNPLIVIEILEV